MNYRIRKYLFISLLIFWIPKISTAEIYTLKFTNKSNIDIKYGSKELYTIEANQNKKIFLQSSNSDTLYIYNNQNDNFLGSFSDTKRIAKNRNKTLHFFLITNIKNEKKCIAASSYTKLPLQEHRLRFNMTFGPKMTDIKMENCVINDDPKTNCYYTKVYFCETSDK